MRASPAPFVVVLFLALAAVTIPARPAHATEYGTVTLAWTAPGDDSLIGTATAYDLRYFSIPINSTNFFTSFRVTAEPTPITGGKTQTFTVHGLTPGAYYYFAIRTLDDAGNWSALSNVLRAQATYAVGVDDAPLELSFSNPFPNPARGVASFSIALPAAGTVDVRAYDISGRLVRTLLSRPQPAGRSTLSWDLRDDDDRALGAGMYLVRARLGDRTFVRRVTVTR